MNDVLLDTTAVNEELMDAKEGYVKQLEGNISLQVIHFALLC